MGKKYEKYSIIVEYLNGTKETVNLMGINTSNHKKMLEVYHRIKNTYSDKAKTIDFVGVSRDGTMGIMFTKPFKPQGREELRQDISDIMNNVSKEIQLIKEKYFYHHEMIGALTKLEDIKKHELGDIHRTINNQELRDKETLRVGNELGQIDVERRWHKDQLFIINKLQNNNIHCDELNFTHLSNVFKVKTTKPIMKQLSMKVAEELNLYTEVKIVDKDKQINKLKKIYERIIEDPVENKLIAYNKAKVI